MARDESTRKTAQPVYYVKDDPGGDENKSRWTQVGMAFEHSDGKGWNILIDVPLMLPDKARLTVRERKPRD